MLQNSDVQRFKQRLWNSSIYKYTSALRNFQAVASGQTWEDGKHLHMAVVGNVRIFNVKTSQYWIYTGLYIKRFEASVIRTNIAKTPEDFQNLPVEKVQTASKI